MFAVSQPQRLLLHAYTKGQEHNPTTNNPLLCAERRLINDLYRQAQRNGVKANKIPTWIHRKFKNMTIVRETSLGLGNSFPCIYCRSTLEKLDIRVTCFVDDEVRCVRISETCYESKKTTGQILKNQPERTCMAQSSRQTRRTYKEVVYSKPG